MMNLLPYIPLNLEEPDGLFDNQAAEKFISEGAEVRQKGTYRNLRLYLTDQGRWILDEVEIGTFVSCLRQVDDTTARAWLEDNGYTKAIQRYFPTTGSTD